VQHEKQNYMLTETNKRQSRGGS